jgi:hypothetical protein
MPGGAVRLRNSEWKGIRVERWKSRRELNIEQGIPISDLRSKLGYLEKREAEDGRQ